MSRVSRASPVTASPVTICPISVLLVAVTLAAAAGAQTRAYYPDNKPAEGPSSYAPFGHTSTSDPSWSNQTMQILVPQAKLGNTKRDIRAIGFAPVASRTRAFEELKITLRQTLATTLQPEFHKNWGGFTAVAQYHVIDWPVTADSWNRITVNFPYSPVNGNLLVEITVLKAGSTGSGDPGFRQDPALSTVWASWTTSAPKAGTVGNIAPRLEITFDGEALSTFADSGCKGSNAKTPVLSLGGNARIGGTFQVDLADGPDGAGVALLLWGFRPLGPIDLTGIGAPGCALRTRLDLIFPIPTQSGKASFVVPIPNDPKLGQLEPMTFQWLPFDPSANALTFITSNWGQVTVGI